MLNQTKKSKSTKRKSIIISVLVLVLILAGARVYLPFWLTDYVNNSLNNIKYYNGSIERVDVHLYRGAYTINQLKIFKKEKGIPVPFFEADETDLSIQWSALLDGRIVSDVYLKNPKINFAGNKYDNLVQTGKEVNWIDLVNDLMPIDINLITLNGGEIAYRNFATKPEVNVYIKNLQAEVRNLRNTKDEKTALPSPIIIEGDSIGNGKFQMEGKLNVLKLTPDMDLNIRLENVYLPAINNYSKAFAFIDFEKGTLNIYSELVVKDNKVSGYVKPLASDIEVVDFKKDKNPVKTLWESVAAVFIEVFTNQPKDQFATKVEIQGTLNDVKTNKWSALAGMFKNAFVKAFSRTTDDDVEYDNTKS